MLRCAMLSVILLFSVDQKEWELKKNEDNIKVYTRKVTTSDFKELKSSTVVKASFSSVINLLCDVENYTKWVYKCVTSKGMNRKDDTEVCSYQLFDAPWPLQDRDVVARMKVKQDPKTKVITVSSGLADGLVEEKEGIVRIKNFHTLYTLTSLGGGWIRIDYELGTEPGGTVPAWLANLVMVNGPFETQAMMNQLIQTAPYKTSKLSFIAEP
jgi:hypothetical protein